MGISLPSTMRRRGRTACLLWKRGPRDPQSAGVLGEQVGGGHWGPSRAPGVINEGPTAIARHYSFTPAPKAARLDLRTQGVGWGSSRSQATLSPRQGQETLRRENYRETEEQRRGERQLGLAGDSRDMDPSSGPLNPGSEPLVTVPWGTPGSNHDSDNGDLPSAYSEPGTCKTLFLNADLI